MSLNTGNGFLKKLAYAAITTIIGAAFYGYVGHVDAQIDTLQARVDLAVSSDSLKAVEHSKLPMHDGAKEEFNKKQFRYIRDSAETAHFRDNTAKSLVGIDSTLSWLTRWLMDKQNDSAFNGRNP